MFTLIKERYKAEITNTYFRYAVVISSALFIVSGMINYYAGTYATESASNAVTDIVLSNTRVYDVDAIFIYGSFVLTAFVIGVMLVHPKRIPFTLYSLSLFILTRSVFITLTHIAPYPTQAALDLGRVASKFIFGGDLFFSGHTGIPFLMALVYWQHKGLRYIFIACSILFGTVALLGHLHYSIDVFAAFFITYTIFHISERLFKRERELFHRL